MTETRPQALTATGRFLEIDTKSVKTARDWAAAKLIYRAADLGLAGIDAEHVDDVLVVVSELVTNAIKYGNGDRTHISLEIGVWSRWTLVTVDDRDPVIPDPVGAPAALAQSGRGLMIVGLYAERFWWRKGSISKTACAAILHSGVEGLTPEDELALDREMVR